MMAKVLRKTAAFTAEVAFIDRLKALADKERRTLSQMILILLEEALAARAED